MMKRTVAIGSWLCAAALFCTAAGQQQGKTNEDKTNSGKTPVFVADSYSSDGLAKGGTRPQIVEAIKTFGERCSDMAVTLKQDQAEYVVLLEHDGKRKVGRKRNRVAVVDRSGRVIYSHSTRTLGNAVQDGCRAIREAKSQGAKTIQQAAYR